MTAEQLAEAIDFARRMIDVYPSTNALHFLFARQLRSLLAEQLRRAKTEETA